MTPRAWPVWSPGTWLTGFLYGAHKTLLHNKYISCAPHPFWEDVFKFSHYKSMEANAHKGMASLEPKEFIDGIYDGDYKTLLHTKYISCGPHAFGEEDCF